MFYYLEGTVTVIENNVAVIDVGGVGYLCYVSLNTVSHLIKGKKSRLYTYCNVKEDAFDIYGFYDISEKRCFEMLLSVSGVGPKAALAIMSSVSPEGLLMAIISEDEKSITKAPGVGKKIAQRIILELRDKVNKENDGLRATKNANMPAGLPSDSLGGKLADVNAALVVLGYTPGEISAVLKSIDLEALTVEEAIKLVLKNTMK